MHTGGSAKTPSICLDFTKNFLIKPESLWRRTSSISRSLHLLPNTHKYPFINKLRRGSLITGESHYISSACWIIEPLVAVCAHCKYAHKLVFLAGPARGPRTHQSNQAPAPPPAAAERRHNLFHFFFWLGRVATWTNTLNWISPAWCCVLAVSLQRQESRTSDLWRAKRSLLTRPNKSEGRRLQEHGDLCHFFQPPRHLTLTNLFLVFFSSTWGFSRSRQEPFKRD